jgi:hypothetical protein
MLMKRLYQLASSLRDAADANILSCSPVSVLASFSFS